MVAALGLILYEAQINIAGLSMVRLEAGKEVLSVVDAIRKLMRR
jgi:hypothetical protein